MDIKKLNEAIEAKKAVLDDIFGAAGEDLDIMKVKSLPGDYSSKMNAIKVLNEELAALVKQREETLKLQNERQHADAATGYTGSVSKNDPGGPAVATSCPAKTKTFQGMFPQAKLDNGGFHSFNEYLEIVTSGRTDPRLKIMTIGSSSGGGFAVPIQYAAEIIDAALEQEIVRPRATVWPMASDILRVPSWDGLNHTSSLFGGFAGVWLAEGATATRQTPKLRQIELKSKKLAVYTQASREMSQDGINFDSQLADALVKSLSWYLDSAFLTGSGVGEPLGVMSDPALVTVSKESAQDEDTFNYGNAVNMLSRLHPSCFNNAVWIVNPTLIPELLTMAIISAGATSFVPAVVQSADGSMNLLTRPLIFSEKMSALGDLGDILLVDLSKYCIGLRQEIILDKNIGPGWTEDAIDYRVIARCDGMGMWDAPVSPAHGETLSWCVTLEERGS